MFNKQHYIKVNIISNYSIIICAFCFVYVANYLLTLHFYLVIYIFTKIMEVSHNYNNRKIFFLYLIYLFFDDTNIKKYNIDKYS